MALSRSAILPALANIVRERWRMAVRQGFEFFNAPLGFKTVDGFEYSAELEERRLSKPDAFEYLHTLTVQSGPERVDVMAVIQSPVPLNAVIQLTNFFDAVDIVLLSVDAGTGEALRDGNGDLIKYNFGNTNWIPADAAQLFVHHPP